MVVETMPGSNRTLLISPTVNERTCRVLFRLKPRPEQNRSISRRRSMDQKHPKSHRFRTCLMFPSKKDQARMEQGLPSIDPPAKGTEGSLKELALRWFTETQAPLILHNGIFPTWFQGFITRKHAEETLQDRELGCFLLRLSDKAIGYVLSYRGRDRCRHFVINQSKSGRFVVSGDTEVHNTLSALIEFYKTSPIEPFGEYLTSSCHEASTEDLYDVIRVNPEERPPVGVRAVKSSRDQQSNRVLEEPPMLPPKSRRTPEGTPPERRGGGALESGSSDDPSSTQARVLYAHLEKHRARETARPAPGPGPVYSEVNLLDCRSKSLPLLDNISDEQHSLSPPRLSPQPPRQATCHAPLAPERELSSRPTSSHSLDYLCNGPIYHLAGRPGMQLPTEDTGSLTRYTQDTGSLTRSIQDTDPLYAEVPSEPVPSRFLLDNTYEQIPEHGLRGEAAKPETNNNTYESLETLKPKHTPSSWGIKNDKWRWFFPEVRRK